MQAISGAGYPGVPSMDIMANVIPFIGGEEEKMQQETQKILGDFRGDHIEPLAAKVSAHCNRVPVVDGHTVTVSVEFSSQAVAKRICARAIDGFTGVPQQRNLPSAPPRPVIYLEEAQPPAAAQGRRARPRHDGVHRPPAPLPGARLQVRRVMGHNTVRGAAGAAVLNAELMHRKECWIEDGSPRDTETQRQQEVLHGCLRASAPGTERITDDRDEIRRHVGGIGGRHRTRGGHREGARGAPARGGGLRHGQDHQQAAGHRRRRH